ncbi:MAG: helix-turn-helix domain-containing protein [Clostridia bacterium]|nr:helix-turn-helix domain-containing protein [Clostridia bacterium]
MKDIILDIQGSASDIIPIFVGNEKCTPAHSFGPAVRDYHLIHFCLHGCGKLFDKFGEHEIYAGECFIIRPGEITTYTADSANPWHYVWIAFRGNLAERFSTDRSVYEVPAELSRKFFSYIEKGVTNPDIYTSIIYELSYHVVANTESADSLSHLRRYVRYNYMEDVTVDGLARSFGFERSYLFRLFKAKYGIGVKDYITEVRMKNAKRFLSEGHSVYQTAAMVGYKDEFNFSKAFKKYFGVSASEYKKEK